MPPEVLAPPQPPLAPSLAPPLAVAVVVAPEVLAPHSLTYLLTRSFEWALVMECVVRLVVHQKPLSQNGYGVDDD